MPTRCRVYVPTRELDDLTALRETAGGTGGLAGKRPLTLVIRQTLRYVIDCWPFLTPPPASDAATPMGRAAGRYSVGPASMRILTCISTEHDVWLLALAVLVCGGGSWVALELYRRARQRSGRQQAGWLFLAAVAAGCSVWCTHFVAMLAYRPDVPAVFDPVLTILSLFVVIIGIAVALRLAAQWQPGDPPDRWLLAGILLGGSVSGMHYVGMLAYGVQGLTIWDPAYVIASVALAITCALGALWFAARGRRLTALGFFVLCILTLHFTGMAALTVIPFGDASGDASSFSELAVAVTFAALLVAATGAVAHMIDTDVSDKTVTALRQMALVDGLTGLPNRNSFSNYLELKLARARSEGRNFAVVIVDFDKFKAVNDVHGHEGGDALLKTVAARMTAELRDGEFLARIGGDEFAALCPLSGGRKPEDFIRRLERALASPVRIKEFDVLAHASFGVSLYPQDGDTPAQIVGNADLAMYRAKADPMRGVSYYEAAMDEAARGRRELVLEIRTALEQGAFELHYQPQLRIDAEQAEGHIPLDNEIGASQVIGYEALLRWNHPARGYIPPSDFVPLAEESGLILPIGEWVLRTACRDAAGWTVPHRVAVNISAVQIMYGDLPRLVAAALKDSGLDPSRLELEVTETSLMEERQRCLAVLNEIRALGVMIAIDDFGTGYSSLDVLRVFPFERIKLDRSFMRDVTGSPEALAILRAVLALGHSLKIKVLAEGVETVEQLALLEAEGCEEVQGYLLGRPGPMAQMLGLAPRGMVGTIG